MPEPVTSTSASTLERHTPDILRQTQETIRTMAATEAGFGATGPGDPPAGKVPPAALRAVDQAVTDGVPARGIPATAPQIMALTAPPPPGGVIRLSDPNGLGRAINQLFRMPENDPSNPPGSNWTNRNDIRVVLPVVETKDGAISTNIQTLPGRNQSWATFQVSEGAADNRLNLDGMQAGVRLGIGGPLLNQWTVSSVPMPLSDAQHLQWAEFRAGAEGLVFTGRMVDGNFSLTSFDLEQGYFKSKVDAAGHWASNNLAIAIPVGLAAAGGAVLAVHTLADKTGKDIAIPIGIPVYDRNGIFVRPSVRPIFGKDQFLKFGGADLNLGYTQPGRFSVSVLPGYNNDPTLGPKGVTIGARANVAMPLNGVAGAEVRYNPQGGVSAFVGVGFRF
jgi:hypothetical protein